MKKIKLILPMLVSASTIGMVAPIASCAPTTTFAVTLYSDIGSFEQNKKIVILPNIPSGTKLKDVKGYVKPYFPTFKFKEWTDIHENVVSEDTKVSSNMTLVATYADIKAQPENFTTDSWKTVIDVCNQPGFTPFARAYCGYTGQDEDEAMVKIREWIATESNIRDTYLKNSDTDFVSTHVRLIGIDHDPLVGSAEKKAKFTFEFSEIVGVMSFNDTSKSGHFNEWYVSNANVETSCLLRDFLNNEQPGYFREQLPSSLNAALVQVQKQNISYDNEDVYISSDFLFPLSRIELNDISGWKPEEGQTPYEYYQDETREHSQTPLRIKKYIGTEKAYNYWTRSTFLGDSPDPQYPQYMVAGVVNDGGIHPAYMMYSGLGYAPAFCIGVEE